MLYQLWYFLYIIHFVRFHPFIHTIIFWGLPIKVVFSSVRLTSLPFLSVYLRVIHVDLYHFIPDGHFFKFDCKISLALSDQ